MASPARVDFLAVQSLGLDATAVDLSTVEVIACALRRAAAFLCPCAERTLVRALLEPLHGLHDEAGLRTLVEQTLEALVTHGDLLELRDVTQEEAIGVVLYASPPSFVRRRSGAVLILGVAPDGVSPLPENLEQAVEYVNHIRVLAGHAAPDLSAQLEELGFIELPLNTWMKAPGKETPVEHLERVEGHLAVAPRCGEVPGLVLLDPSRPVSYYRGRWVVVANQTGHFVARRPQAYGADLWCFVDVEEGHPVRLIDLPLRDDGTRGCDDAWRFQAAIDHTRGVPQTFRRRRGPGGNCVLDFFSPVPMWARRRWDAVGEPIVASACLFSYKFSETELVEEIDFISEHLWLAEAS